MADAIELSNFIHYKILKKEFLPLPYINSSYFKILIKSLK